MKKVTVIITCYNASKYVARTINSVINQTYSNVEIIAGVIFLFLTFLKINVTQVGLKKVNLASLKLITYFVFH